MEKFKAWITKDGKEMPFGFDKEHYVLVEGENGDVDFMIRKGWIRITAFNDKVAIQINERNEETIYRVSKFFRLRKLTDLNYFIEVLNEDKKTYEINKFADMELMLKN